MTKWILSPIAWFAIALIIISYRNIKLAMSGIYIGDAGGRLDSLALGYIVACWVWRDVKKKGSYTPTDWVLLFPWIYLPSHLWKTRKWKGIGWLLGIAATLTAYTLLESTVFEMLLQ